MRSQLKYIVAVLISFCLYLANGAAMANTAQEDVSSGRASLLFIALLAGVVILIGRTAIAIAKNKMDKEAAAAKAHADLEARKSESETKG